MVLMEALKSFLNKARYCLDSLLSNPYSPVESLSWSRSIGLTTDVSLLHPICQLSSFIARSPGPKVIIEVASTGKKQGVLSRDYQRTAQPATSLLFTRSKINSRNTWLHSVHKTEPQQPLIVGASDAWGKEDVLKESTVLGRKSRVNTQQDESQWICPSAPGKAAVVQQAVLIHKASSFRRGLGVSASLHRLFCLSQGDSQHLFLSDLHTQS